MLVDLTAQLGDYLDPKTGIALEFGKIISKILLTDQFTNIYKYILSLSRGNHFQEKDK